MYLPYKGYTDAAYPQRPSSSSVLDSPVEDTIYEAL